MLSKNKKDPNLIFLIKFFVIVGIVFGLASVLFFNIKLQQNLEYSEIKNNPDKIKNNEQINQPISTQTQQVEKPIPEISSYNDRLSNSIWEMPFSELEQYNTVETIKLTDDGYLFVSETQSHTNGKLIQTDKNGLILWEKLIKADFNHFRNCMDEMDSYIFIHNIAIRKDTQQIIKRLENSDILFNITSFDDNFVASDKNNTIYFLDKDLNKKWHKFIKANLSPVYTYENINGETKLTQTHYVTNIIVNQILKTKDNNILVSIRGKGLIKYDLNGNIINEVKLDNWQSEATQVVLADDGSIFVLNKENDDDSVHDGIAIITKFDSNLNVLWSKKLHKEKAEYYITYKLSNYKDNNLLLVVKKSDKKDEKTWIKFIEFDLDGNKLDENTVGDYPLNTGIQVAERMHDGSVLVGGNILYERYTPPVLIKDKLVKLSDELVSNALFIKIQADIPLGKQKIRKFSGS